MLAKVHSFVLIGIDAIVCEVEADVSQRGPAKTTMIGSNCPTSAGQRFGKNSQSSGVV
jgi:hypothetical protein